MHFVLLIVAYQPNLTLLDVLHNTINEFHGNLNFKKAKLSILVVNDGSTLKISHKTFSLIQSKIPSVSIVNRAVNGGQGAALKTGFTWILENLNDADYVITADADGQHLPKDIISIFEVGINVNFEMPVLGVRHFGENVPLRSKIGNIITSYFVRFLYGCKIEDTQTGLRGFPVSFLNTLILKKSNRFNYNSEVLVHLMMNRGFIQKKITTVYTPGNPSSHFRPLMDSFKIYWVLFRNFLSCVFSAFFDITLFTSLIYIGFGSFDSVIYARCSSVLLSYFLHKKFTFKSNLDHINMGGKYFLLALANMLIVAKLTETIGSKSDIKIETIYIIISIIMFLINFIIQKKFIFKGSIK